MKTNFFLVALMLFIVSAVNSQEIRSNEYPNSHLTEWKKMNESKHATFEWFKDAKYGMFIHWGLYSIPGGVWKGKTIEEYNNPPNVAEWIMLAAKIPREEYALLAKQFNPVAFNADSIVSLAKNAGMKYLVITAKHHDGFALYDSKFSSFNVMDATPFKRDIISELYEACKKQNLEFGLYYSHNIDWMDGSDSQFKENLNNPSLQEWQKTFGANIWDPSPNSFEEYLQKKAYPQVKELMEKYPGMKMLWYDMAVRMSPEQSFSFYKLVYDMQPQIIITERVGNNFGDYLIPGDNTIPQNADELFRPWETVGTTNNSWGYKSYDNDYKTPKEILYWLVEIVSKGGNYMLNIGPDGNGAVPVESVNNLLAVGKWLKINSEAIYGTKKWKISKEGPTQINIKSTEDREEHGFNEDFSTEDFWFTSRGKVVYAISLEKPLETIVIKSLNRSIGKIKSAEILGYGKVKFHQDKDGLRVNMPNDFAPLNGYVIKVNL